LFSRVAILFLSASLGSSVEAETLAQAISRAVQYFPEIQAAQARREASSAQTGQARSEYFPSINITAGEGRETSRNVSTRTLGNDPTLTRQEAELSLTQLLFDGGATGGQVRRYSARTESAAFAIVDTSVTVGLRAGQTFIEVRRLREQLAIARENLATHEKTLDDVNVLADSGRGRRADVIQAEARRSLAASALEQLTGQLNQTEDAYKYLIGRPPGVLDEPSELGPALPRRLEEAVDAAVRAHPAVRSAEKELDAAQFDRESARARLAAPRITIEAGASRNRDLDGIVGPNSDNYVMLRLRYNLFRGFGDSERVREAEARFDEAFANVRRVRNEVERDVRQSWDALASDRARLPQLARYARASADVAEAYRLQFQLGQRSLLDVLNSENERFIAMSGYIGGRAAVTTGEVRLLAVMGRLLEVMTPLPQQPALQTTQEPVN
jgi:adhesin transport system outer membrane protein